MEWRCAWCEKPHAENDPPCDNCGHGKFERTTVPVSDLDGPEQLEWVCTECGRSHPRNSPPCSRCGNTKLERQQLDYDDLDVGDTGYADLLTPRYAAAVAGVAVMAIVLALGFTGVVELPAALGGQPTVSDVPGEADGTANLSLADVEAAYLDAVNDRRESLGHASLDRDDALDDAAAYVNHRVVKADYTDWEPSGTYPPISRFGGDCPRRIPLSTYDTAVEDGEPFRASDVSDAEAFASALARSIDREGAALAGNRTALGVDLHVAPDGVVYVAQATC